MFERVQLIEVPSSTHAGSHGWMCVSTCGCRGTEALASRVVYDAVLSGADVYRGRAVCVDVSEI